MNFISTFEELNKLYESCTDTDETTIDEGLFGKKPTHALIVELDEPENGYEWYVLAVSSDQAKLKQKETEAKASYKKSGFDTATKIVDIKTAIKLTGDKKFSGADNLDEGLFGKKPKYALISKQDKPSCGYWWDILAVSSKQDKLEQKEAEIRASYENDDSNTEMKIVDLKTATKLTGILYDKKFSGANIIEDYETDEASEENDTEVDIEIIEDEPKQLVLECAKCGGLALKPEADVKVDEKTDLANIEEACQYCEATEGFKIMGALVSYAGGDVTLEEAAGRHYIPRIIKSAIDKARAQFKPNAAGEIAEAEALKIAKNIIDDPKFKKYTSTQEAGQAYDTMLKYIQTGKTPADLYWDEFTELDELFNANVKVDAKNFAGSGNKVSVLNPGLEALDTKKAEDDEDLDELFDANVTLDAKGFGGKGNDVSVL